MAEENGSGGAPVNVPIGAAVAVAVAAAAAGLYTVLSKNQATGAVEGISSSGKGMMRKAGLTALVYAIENDATRKAVVAILKAMARRS